VSIDQGRRRLPNWASTAALPLQIEGAAVAVAGGYLEIHDRRGGAGEGETTTAAIAELRDGAAGDGRRPKGGRRQQDGTAIESR